MGNTVKDLRQALSWSQERLARHLEKSVGSIRGYESGRQPPEEVIVKLLTLAAQYGIEEVAKQIESQTLGRISREKLGRLVEKASRLTRVSSPANREASHQALDIVMDSDDPEAIESVVFAIQSALHWVCTSEKNRQVNNSFKPSAGPSGTE